MKTEKKRAVLYTRAMDIPRAFAHIQSLQKYCADNEISVVKHCYDYFDTIDALDRTMDLLIQQSDKEEPINYLIIPTREIKGYRMNILRAVLAYCSTELVVVEYKDLI